MDEQQGEQGGEQQGEQARVGRPKTGQILGGLAKLEARRLAEEGVPFSEIAKRLNTTVRALQLRGQRAGWATPARVSKALTRWGLDRRAGSTDRRFQVLLYEEIINAEQRAKSIGQSATPEQAWAGAVRRYKTGELPTECLMSLGESGGSDARVMGASGIGVGGNTPSNQTQISPQDPLRQRLTEPAQALTKHNENIIDRADINPRFGLEERMAGVLAPLEVGQIVSDEMGVGGRDYQMLPQSYALAGGQLIRDAEGMLEAEEIRAVGYRENISRALLNISKYAVALSEKNPKAALLVCNQLQKLDSMASKRFGLDRQEETDGAGEALKSVSAASEAGEDVAELI